MKNRFLIFIFMFCMIPCFPKTISEIGNNLKLEVQELKELNAQQTLVIDSQNETIESLQLKQQEYDQAFTQKLSEIESLTEKICKQEAEIRSKNKKLRIALTVFIFMFVAKAVIMFLKWKYGIKLPYIINCIL